MIKRPWRKTGVNKICQCGKTFYCEKGKIFRKKYCSIKCRCTFHPTGAKWSEEAKKKKSEAMKGKVFSLIHKQNLSKAHKGIKFTEERRKNRIGLLAGNKHPNWQGGITPINKQIRNSLSYKNWRIQIFKRDNWTCQICKVKGKYLHADHIKPFALFPELRLELSNGRTLCINCHKQTNTFAGRIRTYAKFP